MGELIQPWQLVVLFLILIPLVTVFGVLPYYFICRKAGFSPWLVSSTQSLWLAM